MRRIWCLVGVAFLFAVFAVAQNVQIPSYGSAITGVVTPSAVTTNIGVAIWTNVSTGGTYFFPGQGIGLWFKGGLTNVAGGTNNIGNCVITNEVTYDGSSWIPIAGFKWEFSAASNTIGTANSFIYTNYPASMFIGCMKWRVRTIDNTATNGLLINDFVWCAGP